jgi:hypothetical protein
MNKSILLIILCFIEMGVATEFSANDVLEKVMNRTKGIDQSFQLSIHKQQKGKPDKHQSLQISLYWPPSGECSRMSYVETLAPKNLTDVKFWEQRYKDASPSKRWMTMPITGKLKDVTDKKPNKNEFNFSELEITPNIINNHDNNIMEQKLLNGKAVIILESVSRSKKKIRKKLWIDESEFYILKAEFYTKSGRKSKTIEMGDFLVKNQMTFPQSIHVEDLRKKIIYDVKIENINLLPMFNVNDFSPIGNTIESN